MAKWCLIKEKADKFIEKLKSGEISPEKMDDLSSAERRKFFEDFMGAEDAKKVNLNYERKILNKNREKALITWAQEVSGKNTKLREEMIARIQKNTAERMKKIFSPEDEKAFLSDLAEQRLGIGITLEESKTIFELAKRFKETKELFNKSTIYSKLEEIKGELKDKEKKVVDALIDKLEAKMEGKKITSKALSNIKRYLGEGADEDTKKDINKLVDDIVRSRKDKDLAYGNAKVALEEYVGEIKLGIKGKRTFRKIFEDTAGFTKSTLASIDNSFIGRQGIKTLYSGHPIVWLKSFAKSFETLYKAGIKGEDAVRGIKAEIFSRQNSRNGLYEKMKLDIGIMEEAYPTTLPEKIPLFGRLFKASNQAFTGSAYQMRADLADALIKKAQKQGVDLMDKKQAESIGELINSMTGRGKINFLSGSGQKTVNVALFSPKFLKSQIDTIGHIITGGQGSNFVRKEAVKNLIGMIGSIGSIMYLANKLQPGSVEFDPRSSDFGKIKIGNTRFDISGGMGSFVTLAARIAGGSKSTITGKITKSGEFGARDATALIGDFLENKSAPLLRTIGDIYSKETFDKTPLTKEALTNEPVETMLAIGKGMIIPIPIENAYEAYKNKATEPALAAVLLDMLGIGANIYSFTDNWNNKTTKEMVKFKEDFGYKTLREANIEANKRINEKLLELTKKDEFKAKSPEDKDKEIQKEKAIIKNEIFKKYNFEKPKNKK